MEFISDVLLAAGALGAGFYCLVLSYRLRRFMQLEKGVGGAIAALSAQVDEMARATRQAHSQASESTRSLADLTGRAGEAAARLEGLLAAIDDLPATQRPAVAVTPGAVLLQGHEATVAEGPNVPRFRLVRRRGRMSAAEAA